DIRLAITRAKEASNRFGTGEEMMVRVGRGDQYDAAVVADAGVLQVDHLLNFGVGNVERLELLDRAGAHTRLIEWPVVHKRVLVTPAGQEHSNAENPISRLHIFIVEGASDRAAACAVGDTRRKDRVGGTVRSE